MGHVILKEFFVDRQAPYFTDYVKQYTDLPFLVAPRADARRRLPRRASSSPPPTSPAHADERERRTSRRCCSTRATGRAGGARTARSASGSATPGVGQVEPRPRRRRPAADRCSAGRPRPVPVRAAALRRRRRHAAARCRAACRSAGSAATWSPPSSTCCSRSTACGRDGPARRRGRRATTTPTAPYTPAWQEAITGVPARGRGADRPRVRRQRRGVRAAAR